mgnify:CR=1 FL=1
MSKLIHFKCDKYVEIEGDKISLTKTTPPEAPSRKLLKDKIKDLKFSRNNANESQNQTRAYIFFIEGSILK